MADKPLPFIDAHHHFWDLDRLYYPFLQDVPAHEFFLGDPSPIAKTFLPADYRAAAANHDVVGTVHVEAECDRSMQLDETRWLTELNERDGLPSAIVAHVWFDAPDIEDQLAQHAEFGLLRGIRSKPLTTAQPGQDIRGRRRTMQDPMWLHGYKMLEKFGLSWDLRVPCWHLSEAAEVAAAHPDTPVVLNNTRFPWERS
ncbi:MAG: amidohydrolase, partial [Gammaproteobacteria bacterium]|nr:amidohydrolase [Gammaproteobacteria bacterium]